MIVLHYHINRTILFYNISSCDDLRRRVMKMGFYGKHNLVVLSAKKRASIKKNKTIQEQFIEGLETQKKYIEELKSYNDFEEGKQKIQQKYEAKRNIFWFDKIGNFFGTRFKIGTSYIALEEGYDEKVYMSHNYTSLDDIEKIYNDAIEDTKAGKFDTILKNFESKRKIPGRKPKDTNTDLSVIETTDAKSNTEKA